MFDKFCEKNIWVSAKAPKGGDGSFEKPFCEIKDALNIAVSGSTVALFSGIYDEKLVVQDLCGTIEDPISIVAFNENAEDVISHSDWYFYSAKDIVVKGIVFRATVNAAISLIGETQRCSIKDCVFDECGEISECAVFFGGSGGESNVVENCGFTAPKNARKHIAVMISQSVDENDEKAVPNSTNASIRFCRFENCRTAALIGSDENISGLFGGHEVCSCLFESCEVGVKIKISGTQLCGNIFRNTKNAVLIDMGGESEIFENRFESCFNAIGIKSDDATVSENCFIDSKISFNCEKGAQYGLPVLIHSNTFICGDGREIVSAKEKAAVMASKNIFYNSVINTQNINEKDNIFEKNDIFADSVNGDFSTDINYGCKSGAEKLLAIEDIPKVDIAELFREQEKERENSTAKHGHFSQNLIEERDMFMKTAYFQDEGEDGVQEDDEIGEDAYPLGHNGLRPIGIDGELEDN